LYYYGLYGLIIEFSKLIFDGLLLLNSSDTVNAPNEDGLGVIFCDEKIFVGFFL